MATFVWTLQGSSPTTIDAADKVQFAGTTFGSPITVAAYNTTTHVESSVGANDSNGNTPNNNKFISQAGGGGGDSQADWGGGTEDLDQILNAECALKINFSHPTSVVTSAAKVYSYDGATPATPAPDVDVRMAEKGDANWTQAEGSGSGCALDDQTTATSHDFFVAVSASPATVGAKAYKFRFEVTYS